MAHGSQIDLSPKGVISIPGGSMGRMVSGERMIWKICTFGSLRLFYNNQQLGVHLARTSKALISLLATRQGRSVSRQEIAQSLWSTEYDKTAQHRVSTLLWRLSRLSDKEGRRAAHPLLVIDPSGEVRINGCNIVEIDCVEFEAAVTRCRVRQSDATAEDVAVLTRSVDLYTADFLRELELDWVAEKRQYLRQCYLDILQFLIEHHHRYGNYDEVIAYADLFLRIDPYLEPVHVLMIKACLATGRRSAAAARADACRRAFFEDLGVAVEDETQRLISLLTPGAGAQSKPRAKLSVKRVSPGADLRSLIQLREVCTEVVKVCSGLLLDVNQGTQEGTAYSSRSFKSRNSFEK
jgi:DNA-binding SARP family transcriptional activator